MVIELEKLVEGLVVIVDLGVLGTKTVPDGVSEELSVALQDAVRVTVVDGELEEVDVFGGVCDGVHVDVGVDVEVELGVDVEVALGVELAAVGSDDCHCVVRQFSDLTGYSRFLSLGCSLRPCLAKYNAHQQNTCSCSKVGMQQ
eukprot:gb/GECG01004439.1/.p1 GENE.gb/GECG01004439.1/~~gb/GECG01004439.1/.p1  ORF type:complete len:144 (+),score=19.88 gb/GECG01004439.1/:1-432(+)